MREGALKASVAILRQGGDQQLTSYALKTVTLFAQNQFRALRTFVGVCSFPLRRWCPVVAAEATPKLINVPTIKALVQNIASKDVRLFTPVVVCGQN